MAANEILVSFDVASLFTNVPTDEAVEIIHRRLLEDENPTITRQDCRVPSALPEIYLLQLGW